MRKIYYSSLMLITGLLMTLNVEAQPYEATIIFVGAYESGEIRPEDAVALDSISSWITDVVFMDQGDFNEASADDLYGEGGTNADGVIFSESIGSSAVPNFGIRDNYPVPAVVMEAATFSNDQATEDKWPLLMETGGLWGYGSPDDVDVQWTIADNIHYITEEYTVGDVINYAPEAGRGVPYLHGINNAQILATATREDGGGEEGYIKSQAVALAYIQQPEMVFMNVAYTYLEVGTEDFYNILKRSVEFVFDLIPDEPNAVNDYTQSIKLNVYPNPATDMVTMGFKAQSNTNAIATVFDIAGNEVAAFTKSTIVGNNTMEINTTEFNSGVYIIKLELEGQVGYSKVLVK